MPLGASTLVAAWNTYRKRRQLSLFPLLFIYLFIFIVIFIYLFFLTSQTYPTWPFQFGIRNYGRFKAVIFYIFSIYIYLLFSFILVRWFVFYWKCCLINRFNLHSPEGSWSRFVFLPRSKGVPGTGCWTWWWRHGSTSVWEGGREGKRGGVVLVFKHLIFTSIYKW